MPHRHHRLPTALITAVSTMLAGCSVPGPDADTARVRAVYLYPHTLNVLTSSGALCAGPKPAGAGATWSGLLKGCDHPWPFTVTLHRERNPLRLVLEEIGLTPILSPVATVTVTDGSGREKTFAAP